VNAKVRSRVLKRIKRMGKAVSRVHTVWVDGDDGTPFLIWVMDVCRWIVASRITTRQTKGFVPAQKKRWVVERTQ